MGNASAAQVGTWLACALALAVVRCMLAPQRWCGCPSCGVTERLPPPSPPFASHSLSTCAVALVPKRLHRRTCPVCLCALTAVAAPTRVCSCAAAACVCTRVCVCVCVRGGAGGERRCHGSVPHRIPSVPRVPPAAGVHGHGVVPAEQREHGRAVPGPGRHRVPLRPPGGQRAGHTTVPGQTVASSRLGTLARCCATCCVTAGAA
jgi:hypothetical protein